jgi:hypothetical protein
MFGCWLQFVRVWGLCYDTWISSGLDRNWIDASEILGTRTQDIAYTSGEYEMDGAFCRLN